MVDAEKNHWAGIDTLAEKMELLQDFDEEDMVEERRCPLEPLGLAHFHQNPSE